MSRVGYGVQMLSHEPSECQECEDLTRGVAMYLTKRQAWAGTMQLCDERGIGHMVAMSRIDLTDEQEDMVEGAITGAMDAAAVRMAD